MATPQEIRIKRLWNDFVEMQSIKCPAISWVSNGDPPSHYEVTFHIRSIINPRGPDGSPIYRDEHKMILDIPNGYPLNGEGPVVKMSNGWSPIFHPNFWPGGLVCIWGTGNTIWNPNDTIALLCIQIARMLQFDEIMTQESHRANPAAADWYVSHKHSGLFPTDKQSLPMPDLLQGDDVFVMH